MPGCGQTATGWGISWRHGLYAAAAGYRGLLWHSHEGACLQVWKFPKGINARDLKARLAESRQAETLGLQGEAPLSDRDPLTPVSAAAEKGLPAGQPSSKGSARQSFLIPGRDSPRWLSLQQVPHLTVPFLAQ